jgi:hypothetical protein
MIRSTVGILAQAFVNRSTSKPMPPLQLRGRALQQNRA